MMILAVCFIAAMLFVLAAVEADKDDEMATEAESRMWINALADESKRGHGKRSRYAVNGSK